MHDRRRNLPADDAGGVMRWLADENIPRTAIAYLRSLGEDTTVIAELSSGTSDADVRGSLRARG